MDTAAHRARRRTPGHRLLSLAGALALVFGIFAAFPAIADPPAGEDASTTLAPSTTTTTPAPKQPPVPISTLEAAAAVIAANSTTTIAPPTTTTTTTSPADPGSTTTTAPEPTTTTTTTTAAGGTATTTTVPPGPDTNTAQAPDAASTPPGPTALASIGGAAPGGGTVSLSPGGSAPLVEGRGTGNFSKVLRLLEAAAAGPGPLDDELAKGEESLARLEVELDAAHRDVAAAEVAEQTARQDLSVTESALRQAENVLAAPAPAPTPPAPERSPAMTTTRTTVAQARSSQSTRSAAKAREAAEAQRLTLDARLQEQQAAVGGAQARTAATKVVRSEKTDAVGATKRSLEELRQQLWSKVEDPTFKTAARVLVAGPEGQQVPPSRLATADVPAPTLDLYRRAATTCPGLSWTVLAAIGSIESSHGRSKAIGVHSGANFAGAMGPMQFLAGTWAAYGADGDADGARDVYNPEDAVHGAARYLCASGAGGLPRLGDAIWAYNHAGWYVDDVLALALRYGSDGFAVEPAGASADAVALVANPNLVLAPDARSDLLAGVVDPRVVKTLAAVAANHRISVSVIKTGHSIFVAGTDRVSNHFYGRGVDIYAVDGADVSAANDAALQVALALMTTAPELRPDELGSPWPELAPFPGTFSDAGHAGHLHLGWGPHRP